MWHIHFITSRRKKQGVTEKWAADRDAAGRTALRAVPKRGAARASFAKRARGLGARKQKEGVFRRPFCAAKPRSPAAAQKSQKQSGCRKNRQPLLNFGFNYCSTA